MAILDLAIGIDLKAGKNVTSLQNDKNIIITVNDINISKATNVNSALKLRTELSFKQAGVLSNDGLLTQQAIQRSTHIPLKDPIGNPSIVSVLTKDGSKISDWAKFTTESIKMQNGQSMQIHYYKNLKTGKIDYQTQDYKVKGIVNQ